MAQPGHIVGIKLTITEGPETVYVLEGTIDEHFQSTHIPTPQGDTVIFDLQGVKNINSYGVRHFSKLVQKLTQTHKVVMRNCSISLVDQINITPAIARNCHIESFLAPYYCKTCGETTKTLNIIEHWNEISKLTAPKCVCETCQTILDFDALEDGYFQFIEHLSLKKGDICYCYREKS